ncbi:MAG: hypothetical protein JWO58_1104 [Chitinophagaceae bacterium]|nr:hypothetical protein [Chitinophagaceae bacterium]
MKNYILLILAVMYMPYVIFAQSNVSFGTPYLEVQAPYKTYFKKGNEILAIKADGKHVVVQKFSSIDLNLTASKEYNDFPKGYKIEYATTIHGSFYVFYSLADKKNKSIQLFSREIDFEQGTFSSDSKQIISSSGQLADHSHFGFHMSYDHSKLLVHYGLSVSKDNGRVIAVHVFNPALETVWKNQFKSSFTAERSEDLDYAVDNDGNVYFLTEVWKNKQDSSTAQINLSIIKPTTTEPTTRSVAVDKKMIHKIGLFESPDHYVLCAGFYKKNINTSIAGGLFVLKADATGRLYDEIMIDISSSIIHQYTGTVVADKEGHLTLKEVVLEQDGSLTLIGENAYLEQKRYYTPKGLAANAYFIHYDDILITKLDSSGKLSWMKKLPKQQVGRSEEGIGQMSYSYIPNEKNYYLVFLDNATNKTLSQDEAPVNYINGNVGLLTAYEVNKENGAVNKITIINTEDNQTIDVSSFSTNKIISIDASNFVVEFLKKQKEEVLMKATIAQ